MVEGILLHRIDALLGTRWTAVAGYASGAAGYGLLALSPAGWTMVPAVALIALGGLATPSSGHGGRGG